MADQGFYKDYRIIAPEFVEETSTLYGTGRGGVAEILPDGTVGPTVPISWGPYAGYQVSSRTVYDPATGKAVVFYDPIQENIMTTYSGGSGYIQLDTAFNRLNSGTNLENEYGVAGSVNLRLADDSVLGLDVLVSRVTRAGHRLYTSEREGGGYNFNQFPIETTLTEIQRTLGPTARLATADEAARHALLGWLMGELRYGERGRRKALEDAIDAIRSQPGNEELDNYETIQLFLDQASFGNLKAVVRTGTAYVRA